MLALSLMTAPPAQAMPPRPDWSQLTPLVYRDPPEITAPMVAFVANEIARGRCNVTRPADGHFMVRVDVAVLVGLRGGVRAVVPHAIDCPTVEQYGAGLVSTFARNNLVVAPGASDQWYRASVTFDWTE